MPRGCFQCQDARRHYLTVKKTHTLPHSADSLKISTTALITTNGLKHSCVHSIYFTLLLYCILKHKQVLSDLLRWTNSKVGTRSTTEESINEKESVGR